MNEPTPNDLKGFPRERHAHAPRRHYRTWTGHTGCCGVEPAVSALLAGENGYNLFQRGLAKERADADPRGAIRIYEQVLQDKSTDRKLAAQALLRMAECHEKLGNVESRKMYERVVREYGDQKEAATFARARLDSLRPRPAILM